MGLEAHGSWFGLVANNLLEELVLSWFLQRAEGFVLVSQHGFSGDRTRGVKSMRCFHKSGCSARKSVIPAPALDVLLTGFYGQVSWSDSKVLW